MSTTFQCMLRSSAGRQSLYRRCTTINPAKQHPGGCAVLSLFFQSVSITAARLVNRTVLQKVLLPLIAVQYESDKLFSSLPHRRHVAFVSVCTCMCVCCRDTAIPDLSNHRATLFKHINMTEICFHSFCILVQAFLILVVCSNSASFVISEM